MQKKTPTKIHQNTQNVTKYLTTFCSPVFTGWHKLITCEGTVAYFLGFYIKRATGDRRATKLGISTEAQNDKNQY